MAKLPRQTLLRPFWYVVSTFVIVFCSFSASAAASAAISLTPNGSFETQLGMTLSFSATADANVLLYPYVNGTQWGAPTRTDSNGDVTFLIPFPYVGVAALFVSDLPPEGSSGNPFLVGLPFGYSSYSANVSNTLNIDVLPRSFKVSSK